MQAATMTTTTTTSSVEAAATDLLSQLPSDVLISILEKMDLRDATRAGLLSRRWHRLCSQLPRLALSYEDFLPNKDAAEEICYYDGDDDDNGCQGQPQGRPNDALWIASDKMLRVAKALLASRRRNRISDDAACTLSMSLLLRHNHRSLGSILDDAVASGMVRDLQLKVSTTYRVLSVDDDDDDGSRSRYKEAVGAMLRYGRPRIMALLDACPAAFGAGLTRLALEYTRLRDAGDLADILDACPRLEALSMLSSGGGGGGGSSRPRPWSVRHARLADVSFTLCDFDGGLDLAWLPRLQRFTYYRNADDDRRLLSFGHVPCLRAITMSKLNNNNDPLHLHLQGERLSQVLANTAVTDLCLNFTGGDLWVKPEAPQRFKDMFRNLRHLRIHNVHEDCGLTWTMFLLQAAPSLNKLRIKLWDHECEMGNHSTPTKKKNVPWEVAAADFKHYNLTHLTILGFYGSTGKEGIVISYLHSLAHAAVNLEEIHMHENKPCQDCNDTPAAGTTGICRSSFPHTEKDKDTLRESISLISRGDGSSMSFKVFPYSTSHQKS